MCAAPRSAEPFGPFILDRRIAVGGSAEVYLARPKTGDRPVARLVIKRLRPALRQASRFELLDRESAIHQMLEHPNIVEVFGAGMVEDEPYLAMEYVEGVDAHRLLRTADAEGRRVPPDVAVYIARRVLAALDSLHRARDSDGRVLHLVHGDISPSNIYLSVDGAVKLGDFGIARVVQRASPEATGGPRGKWGYIAPELLDGGPFDHRSDLFSLAVVLGELLIGQRIFSGSGQVAVLLAIRDVDIEPLRRAAGELPPGLLDLLEIALARDPARRFPTASALAAALEIFEPQPGHMVAEELGRLVRHSRDAGRWAQSLEGRVRDSVQRMMAVDPRPSAARETLRPQRGGVSDVRRCSGEVLEGVAFAQLVEMIVTGDLDGHDEVALMGAKYRRIEDIPELSRHLLPSTTTQTGQLFEPGLPDFAARLEVTPMLDVLARMRCQRETGALFVESREIAAGAPDSLQRKEIYLRDGRLHHVASSAKDELLGQYLVKHGKLSREQLETALSRLHQYGGRLGDTLVGLQLVAAIDVFRAIRDQGRDRVAALCGWPRGSVAFYRGATPAPVEFPLDLDLASPMIAGAVLATEGHPERLLPPLEARLLPGPRLGLASDRAEKGSAPISLQTVPALVPMALDLGQAAERLRRLSSVRRAVGRREALAALAVALRLGWITAEV